MFVYLSICMYTTCLQGVGSPRNGVMRVMSYLMYMLGTEPGTSARAASALNH